MHWEWAHLRYMRRYLKAAYEGKIRRLIFNLPPRHGKTQQNTIRWPVWWLTQHPDIKVIIGAYNQSTASAFNRQARRIAELHLAMSPDRRDVGDWETVEGGGIRAAGVGSGVTGHGAHVIIIDDPVKSREEAESSSYRERVWDWYKDDLWTRQEPGACIVLTMTRWHEDDLAGRLIEAGKMGGEKWISVNLPALAEDQDPLGRKPGQALCPERYDENALAEAKKTLGNSFYALYQGTPRPKQGTFFQRKWFKGLAPLNVPRGGRRIRYWDKAGTEGGGAYTVGTLLTRVGRNFIVEDVVRGQWSAHNRTKHIKNTTEADAIMYNGEVTTWIEQEPADAGKEAALIDLQDLQGFDVHAERATGDKETRARPFASSAEAGFIYVVKAPWTLGWLDELCAFPTGKYKDQVDSASGAFNKLALIREALFYS